MNFIRLVSNSWQSQVECEALPQERIAPALVLLVEEVVPAVSPSSSLLVKFEKSDKPINARAIQ